MPLAISPTTTDVNVGFTKAFTASGGTGPYVFSIVSGSGSIGSASGIFTPGRSPGVTVVKVTDSLLATASATITVHNAITRVCEIIKEGLDLDNDQVYLWDQKIKIPTDTRLYIAVSVNSCKPFGSNKYLVSTSGLADKQSLNMFCELGVDILSRSADARDRKEEVIMALGSTFSISSQESHAFLVSNLSRGFVNLSNIDGAAIPYRFNITVGLQYFVTKQVEIDYYTEFSDDVTTEA